MPKLLYHFKKNNVTQIALMFGAKIPQNAAVQGFTSLFLIGMNFSSIIPKAEDEKNQRMEKGQQVQATREKQIDFISRLTFIKGKKADFPVDFVRLERTNGKKKKKFRNWCMPLQENGYMRGRVHDFL
jgi:hypothetical protein